MAAPSTPTPRAGVERSVRIGTACVALLLAFYLTGLRVELNVIYPAGSIESVMAHSALTPYQYRILVPAFLGALYDAGVLSRAWLEPQEAGMIVEVLAWVGVYACLCAALRDLGARSVASSTAALALFFLLPFQYLLSRAAPYWYVWDAPAVLFFACGLWCLRQRRFLLYYPLFVLATFNKETTIFLTVVHVLTSFGVTTKRALFTHAAAQVALWLAIKYGLALAFSAHQGLGMLPQVLEHNLESLRTPALLLLLASNFGFLWIPVLLSRSRIEDRFLRRALLVIPVYFAGAMISSEITELRVYGELTPLIVLALYAIVARPGGYGAGGHGADGPRSDAAESSAVAIRA